MSAPVNIQISGLTAREGGTLAAGYSNTTNYIYNGQPKLLPYSTKAAFNATGNNEDLCFPNTRVDIMNQIRAWIDGNDRSNIFWLSGWAGTGKSIIARTISREYYDKGRRGANFFASFFFSRGEEDICNAGKFVTSISVQLAKFPVLGERINKAASDDDGIANKILHDQWKQLVIEPISSLAIEPVRTTLVLVIDALDECDKQGDIWRVFQLLANAVALQTVQLRVLITSRPEKDIRHGFSQFLQGVYQEFILHEIPKSVVDDDIYIFLDHKFGHLSLGDWPGKEAIERLVKMAAGLFIWAATAYRFIYGDRSLILPIAKRRLRLILQSDGLITKPEAELDKIYTTVLKNAANHDYDEEEKESVYGMLREILGSIVCLFSPLSVYSLATLIRLFEEDLRHTLESLHSILDVPVQRACPIRVHHPSFRDFYLDTKRCTDRQLQVDGNGIHWVLASSCMRIMSEKLKKDICNLRLPGALTSQVDDTQIQQFIPEELQYACSYWVQHLQESKKHFPDNGDVHCFLRRHLLCWLETLSLLGKISQGINALISLEILVKADQSPSLHAFIHDAKRFSLDFRYIYERVPLQIYISALLFAPKMSLVRKEFKSQMPNWINGVINRKEYWDQALQTLEGHSNAITALVFSPDGKLIASASFDNTVRLWDSSTGATLQTLEGHLDRVIAIVFSPDGKIVASASEDTTVRLWDSSTGATLQNLDGHSFSVNSVVFSPDGKLVASASDDNTVRLWDSSTGATLQTLEGHSHRVNAVVFSPDGNIVASASQDTTVRLWPWGSSSGATLQNLEGHLFTVNTVVFSPDGKLIASASQDTTVRLWNTFTGAKLRTLVGHSNSVKAVVFSPDGKLIASASQETTVRLWDSFTGTTQQTLEGHSHWVNAVVFSPDGKIVASASEDKTVRLWDSSTGATLQNLDGHSFAVNAVAFSPDGKLVASASHDETVRLWESLTRETLQFPASHLVAVNAVVFSPDGKLIASASYDKTVRLWDSFTGATLHALKGHSDWVSAVVFSPDGKLIASASYDKTVRLWDSFTGATLHILKGHLDWFNAVVFSPDGKLIASASSDNTVRLWDSSTGESLQTLKEHSALIDIVVFSPDSKLVVSASYDKTVRLWESTTGATLHILKGHLDWFNAVVFSPDGKLVAIASYSYSFDHTVRLWSLSSGKVIYTKSDLRNFSSISFSPDGSYLELDGLFFDYVPASVDFSSSPQPDKAYIILQDRWIVGAMGNLLWLPPGCEARCSNVRNTSVVLGHSSGGISCIHFDLSQFQSFNSCKYFALNSLSRAQLVWHGTTISRLPSFCNLSPEYSEGVVGR